MRVTHIQAAVRDRLDARTRVLSAALSSEEVINTVVWETMALLGEWEFVDIVLPAPVVNAEVPDAGQPDE